MTTYEIFHGYDGHVGPFYSIKNAITWAIRYSKGVPEESVEKIYEYTTEGIGGYRFTGISVKGDVVRFSG